ncbi:MAG: hypothetical protein ABTD50_22930 [Polyangiaceae bacterium]
MKRLGTRLRVWRFGGGALVLAAVLESGSCSSSSSSSGVGASEFCAAACPHWIPCSQPAVCNPQGLESGCESACQQNAYNLGESESAFLSCANCVLPFAGNQICDQSADSSFGNVSCPNQCANNSTVTAAWNQFYAAMQSDFSSLTSTLCPCDEVVCSGKCVNLSTDSSNCGQCGTVCSGTGSTCSNGSCGCSSASDTLCSGQCVNLSTDPNNCGQCGTVCSGTGSTCSNGSCGCSTTGDTLCSGQCVNLSTDSNNCGQCGIVCTSGASWCTNATCGTPTCSEAMKNLYSVGCTMTSNGADVSESDAVTYCDSYQVDATLSTCPCGSEVSDVLNCDGSLQTSGTCCEAQMSAMDACFNDAGTGCF